MPQQLDHSSASRALQNKAQDKEKYDKLETAEIDRNRQKQNVSVALQNNSRDKVKYDKLEAAEIDTNRQTKNESAYTRSPYAKLGSSSPRIGFKMYDVPNRTGPDSSKRQEEVQFNTK